MCVATWWFGTPMCILDDALIIGYSTCTWFLWFLCILLFLWFDTIMWIFVNSQSAAFSIYRTQLIFIFWHIQSRHSRRAGTSVLADMHAFSFLIDLFSAGDMCTANLLVTISPWQMQHFWLLAMPKQSLLGYIHVYFNFNATQICLFLRTLGESTSVRYRI
jgi:hypothetical protein